MKRVLIVDDEEKIRDLLEKFLTKNGFDVIKAENGNKAISILRSGLGIDLMVLDVKMPGTDGENVFCEIKSINKKCPVIFLTGSFNAIGSSNILREAGIAKVKICYKPVDLFVFLEMVKKEIGAD